MAKQLSAGVAFLMKKHKIEVVDGTARLEKGDAGAQGGRRRSRPAATRTLTAKSVILATGARARTIPAIGLAPDGERVWTYREAMVPKAAPEVAAGGRLRRHRHRIRQLLPRAGRRGDGGRGAAAHPAGGGRGGLGGGQKAFEKRGHQVPRRRQGHQAREDQGRASPSTLEAGGKAETLEAERAIVAVGIAGNVEDLGLEALGVKLDRGHVVVDAHGATNVAGPLRHRRCRRAAVAGAQGEPRGRRTASSTSPASPPAT